MEIIASILLILGIIGYFKLRDNKACNYMNTHVGKVDIGKMNHDRIMNNLSNYQVNQNLVNGKYDKK